MKLISPISSQLKAVFDEHIYNRTILALGKEAQAIYSNLRAGVTSCGGLACIVIELLSRLGLTDILLCEFDHVEKSNLNRLLGAHFYDGILKTPKALVAARNAFSINPNINLEIVQGDFLEKKNQEKFKSVDILFECSDSPALSFAADRLCLACGIPHFNLKSGAVVENGKLKSVGGQVILIRPDRGFCLQCGNFFDIKEARAEFMDPEEAKRQREMGYVKGETVPQPAVYALNMMVASWAVWMMMLYVLDQDLDFDGISVDALSFQSRVWSEERREGCDVCGKDGALFRGDEVQLLTRESYNSLHFPENLDRSSYKKEGTENKGDTKPTEEQPGCVLTKKI